VHRLDFINFIIQILVIQILSTVVVESGVFIIVSLFFESVDICGPSIFGLNFSLDLGLSFI
jgi:hypothetical protein